MYSRVKGQEVYIVPYDDLGYNPDVRIDVYAPAWAKKDKGIVLDIPCRVGWEMSAEESIDLADHITEAVEKVKKGITAKGFFEPEEVQNRVFVRCDINEIILVIDLYAFHFSVKDALETASKLRLRAKQLLADIR